VSRLRPHASGEPGEPGKRKGIGADLRSRVVTGVAVAAVALAIFSAGRAPTALLCALVIGMGTIELCTALRSRGYRPAVVIALAGSVGLVIGAYNAGESAYPFVLAVVGVGTLLWYLFQPVPTGRPAPGIATTFLAFGYVGVLGGFAGLLLAFPNGIGMIVGMALCTVAGDVGAYFAGRRFGRRKLTAISPNKTVEGLAAGMLASVLVGALVAGSIHPWDHLSGLALGAVVALLAPLGDLCESMLKRDLEVKDLGGLLPGHGGVLDRFDTILFTLPAVYYLVRLLEIV
jgi:phosphatidate cytidylyltransferase